MRLMASTDFALRLLMYLAENPQQKVNTDQMANDLKISRNHLQKIVQNLVAGGFVETVRGVHGGVLLSRPPKNIKVGAVVRWFEDKLPIVECVNAKGSECIFLKRCGLEKAFADAEELFYSHLDNFTIADRITKEVK